MSHRFDKIEIWTCKSGISLFQPPLKVLLFLSCTWHQYLSSSPAFHSSVHLLMLPCINKKKADCLFRLKKEREKCQDFHIHSLCENPHSFLLVQKIPNQLEKDRPRALCSDSYRRVREPIFKTSKMTAEWLITPWINKFFTC